MHVSIKEVRNVRFSEDLAYFVFSLPSFEIHTFALLPVSDSNYHDKDHIFLLSLTVRIFFSD